MFKSVTLIDHILKRSPFVIRNILVDFFAVTLSSHNGEAMFPTVQIAGKPASSLGKVPEGVASGHVVGVWIYSTVPDKDGSV